MTYLSILDTLKEQTAEKEVTDTGTSNQNGSHIVKNRETSPKEDYEQTAEKLKECTTQHRLFLFIDLLLERSSVSLFLFS